MAQQIGRPFGATELADQLGGQLAGGRVVTAGIDPNADGIAVGVEHC
jgi:hypothetical protein